MPYVNPYDDFKQRFKLLVGKNLFRAKEREEDIVIINELSKAQFPVSLKAYGDVAVAEGH